MRLLCALLAAILAAAATPLRASPLHPPPELASVVEGMKRGQCNPVIATLTTLAAQADPTGARAAYLLASCLQRSGHLADARDGFDGAARRHPTLAPHARLRAAVLTLRMGDVADALRRINAARSAPASLDRRWRLLQAEALVHAARDREAEVVLRQLIPQLADRGEVARAWWWRGQAADRRRARKDAAHHYAMVAWGFPESDVAAPAAARLRHLTPVTNLPAAARLYRARRLMELGRLESAERELRSAVRGPLTLRDAADAWYRLGFLRLPSRSRLAARDFLSAARFSPQADRALYWAGRALITGGRRSDGHAVWRRLVRAYPMSTWSARALFGMGTAAEAARAYAEADVIYTQLARRFPQFVYGQEAAWRRGWWRYREGRFAAAEAVFLNAAHSHPGSARASAALYWAAMARARRSLDSRALLTELAAKYPLSYYGHQAARRLGLAIPVPPTTVPVRLADRFAPAHEELGALGFHREAVKALPEAPPSQRSARFLSYHLAQAGDVSASVLAADAGLAAQGGRGLPDRELWELAYPAVYRDAVADAARATGVDAYLILAVMREESRFDPTVVSFAGATGLMQLLPSTARHLIPGRVVTTAGLTHPDINVRHGATYLQRMLNRYGGDTVLALAAYNAGPGAAARFARTLPRAHEAEFIERITIEETRAYVRRVMESYGIYRWLYR